MIRRISAEENNLKRAIISIDLGEAQATFGRLVGHLREAQIAAKLEFQGARLVHLGRKVKKGKQEVQGGQILKSNST